MSRDHRVLEALLQMTVERGCTPAEAAEARARIAEIVKRTGIDVATLGRTHGTAWGSSDWAERATRRAAERRAARAEAERAEAEAAAKKEAEEVARKAAAAAREALLRAQPSMRRLVDLISHGGLTGAELAARMGLQPHTVRAMICRLRQAGVRIEAGGTQGGKTIYRYR